MKTPPGASLSVAAGPAFWKRLHHVQARGDPTRVNFRLRCTRGPHAGAQPGCRCSGGIPLAASSHPFSARCGGGRDPGVRGPGDGGRGTRGSVDLGVQGPRDGGTRVCSGPGDAGTRGAVEGSLRACVRAESALTLPARVSAGHPSRYKKTFSLALHSWVPILKHKGALS